MNHKQSLSVTYGSSDSIEITSKIATLFKSSEVIENINIITSSSNLIDQDQINQSSHYYHEPQYEHLYELLESIEVGDGSLFLDVIPSDQVFVSPFLHIQNKFTIKNQQLKIFLNESSFQMIPNLVHKVKGVKVKKIQNYKIGHGSKQYSNINHQIEINLDIVEHKFKLFPELKFIISKLFHKVDIKISSSKPTVTASLQPHPIILTAIDLNPDVINLSPIFFPSSSNDAGEIYEYLTLLSLDSNNEQLKYSNNVDDFLSIYKVPTTDIPDRETKIGLYKFNYQHANTNSLSFILQNPAWNVISLQYFNRHILLFKDINNITYIFESK
ncbi:hypothetical protein DFJ63DRAFT_319779 [Scheffersomyces coipomensis]|uniref:uncharacterized protein n=1 Tax=Scheffersomyces coipomensis TaxID=1788519 RepID=UPI00315D8316